jgi:hypothetical protein
VKEIPVRWIQDGYDVLIDGEWRLVYRASWQMPGEDRGILGAGSSPQTVTIQFGAAHDYKSMVFNNHDQRVTIRRQPVPGT